jgi:NAD(P)-dependent dehydrogenase (short-subunit alcohol dehydrogenase family)
MNVAGRAAIVTGAGSGIGEGIAKALAAAGARVAVVDIDARRVDRVVAEIQAGGGVATGVRADISRGEAVARMCQQVADTYASIDILVNNAGIIRNEVGIDEMTDEDWDVILTVNLKSQFLCCRAAVPYMKRNGYGRIINIASRSWLGGAGLANYAVSKGGVISLTRSLAMELGPHGITVNCVSPTLVKTALFLGMPEEEQERDLARARLQPIPRLGLPEDVAYAVLFFAGEGASFITGQNIYVGGGADLRTSSIL